MGKAKKKTLGKKASERERKRARRKNLLIVGVSAAVAVAAAIAAFLIFPALDGPSRSLSADNAQTAALKEYIFRDNVIPDAARNGLAASPAGGGPYVVFLSICDPESRALVARGRGDTLAKAWDDADRQAAALAEENGLDPLWVKADLVRSKETIPTGDLQQLLGRHNSFFRQGVSFDKNFDTAYLEEELNGNRMLTYSAEAQESNNEGDYVFRVSRINEYRKDYYGLEAIGEIPEEITLFSTLGYFCGEDLAVHELYNEGLEKGRREVGLVDAGLVTPIAISASMYLRNMIKPDGEYVYGYYPITHRLHGSYNILRHSGTTWALLNMLRLMDVDESHIADIKSAVECLVLDYVEYDDEGRAFVVERKADEVKLGGSGLAIIMLTEYMDVFETDLYFDLVCRMADGILSQQNEDGSYYHVLNFPGFTEKDEYRTVFYDGEATFALSRAYSITGDERYLQGAVRAIEYFIENDYVGYRDHWLSYAVNEVTKYVHDPRYYDLALRNIQENLGAIWSFRTTSHIHSELLYIGWETYVRMLEQGIETAYLRDEFDFEFFVRTIYKRAFQMLDGYFYPEFAMYMRYPAEAAGCFFIRHDSFRIRIDDIQHFIGAYYLYIKYYDEFSPYLVVCNT